MKSSIMVFMRYFVIALAAISAVSWIWSAVADRPMMAYTLQWSGLGAVALGGVASAGNLSSRRIAAGQETYMQGSVRRENLDAQPGAAFSWVMIAAGFTAMLIPVIWPMVRELAG